MFILFKCTTKELDLLLNLWGGGQCLEQTPEKLPDFHGKFKHFFLTADLKAVALQRL
jgi:hypothetical protein